jgi:hypothetical protein
MNRLTPATNSSSDPYRRIRWSSMAAAAGRLPRRRSTVTPRAAARAERLLRRMSFRRPDSIWAIADQLIPE